MDRRSFIASAIAALVAPKLPALPAPQGAVIYGALETLDPPLWERINIKVRFVNGPPSGSYVNVREDGNLELMLYRASTDLMDGR